MRRSIQFIFIYILLRFLNYINGQLIAGHVIYRHGDRTPVTTFPSDPVKPSDWPNGLGQLTIAGIEQQHRLGKFIRNRYETILNEIYSPNDIVVRSTDVDRTLMSAQSNLVGLYPVVHQIADSVPIQPMPIHTVSINLDFLLGQNDCPRYDQLEDQINQSPEVKDANQRYSAFFEQLEQWTNLTNITIYDAWEVADTIFVEHIYNKTPTWALDPAVRKNLSDINDLAFHYLFANNDTQRIRGGPSIADIWSNMNNAVNGSFYKKVKMYSAHDTTVSAVLSFLGINYPHQPQYASALFVDLYQQNSSYFVRVEYLNQTDSNESNPNILNGCQNVNCSFENFTAIYKPRFPASVDVECRKQAPPNPNPTDNDSNLTVALVLVIIGLAVMILLIFLCHFARKPEAQPFLLDDVEQSSVCA